MKANGGAGDAPVRQLRERLGLVGGGLLDLIYPPRCLICERFNRPALCAGCADRFRPVPIPPCPVCGRPVEEASACRLCAATPGGWGFDTARAAGVYEGPLRHAVHRLKYGRAAALGEPLGAFLANRCLVDGLLGEPFDVVVPVPVHPARARQRGFNQAALLAAPLAAMRGVPLLARAVARTRRTPPQVGLTPAARRHNLDGAFTVPDAALVAGRRVVLVDDVFTTGTTVSACARALKAAGAQTVHVATLAAGG